jgi:hypothetical protein
VNEGETDVVGADEYLAYPGTDRPSALPMIVSQAVLANDLGGSWSDGRDNASEFPDDVSQLRRDILKILLNGARGQHVIAESDLPADRNLGSLG